ncbi:ribosome quality control complex subunit TCF25 isoform X1 [Musca domestica]|uniref:Ribosome quality control complex subunit TCF25 isoform X1 n=1 Tax=Musca domestica TaxID=7370 RepID=A0A9J7D0W9_MUSDO|nr:ribosome quality control complex subunit TCF25 isoform X1 [Musca domestica]
MSSRVLKKLQGADELQPNDEDVDNLLSSEGEEDPDLQSGKGKSNFFDLLNQQSPSESEVKEDDNETEHASAATNLETGPAASKKKKKKRKKKSKYTGNHISSEDNELTDKFINDIDPLLNKVSVATTQNPKLTTPRIEIDKSLMAVELKNLNPQNEMRRTFGKRVVKIENKRGRQKLTLKSTYMVTAKESWPPVTKNIINMRPCQAPDNATSTSTMARVGSMDKVQWFAFEHSQYYQSVQNLFLTALERTDSDFLINLIRRCPYHVDSLIQLSELCKMTEDFSLAAELIERAVLVLETSLHPSFSLTNGNCRLDYRRQENRALFVVLFKHAQYLEARACCRTAFEISKLILSLNPDVDPLAMVLIIDYYAIRSKQHAWLVKFYEEYNVVRNLSQLPNMAYSYALALFLLHGDGENADKALQYALLMFPGVLKPLLDELSVQTDKRVLSNSYFNSEVSGSQSPALHQLVSLYVCRAKVIWRQNNILPWLERNVNAALDRIESKDEVIQDYKQKRSARYVQPPRPILRHVILSDYKEKVPLAPFVAKEKEAIMMYDPLPPLDSVNFYERKSSSSSPTTASNRSVSMFFQSLLPTFNLQNAAAAANAADPQQQQQVVANVEQAAARVAAQVPADAANEVAEVDRHLQALNMNLDNAAAGTGQGAVLRQSFTDVVHAMREFIQSVRSATENLQPGENDGNDSTEEDTTDYFD